MNNDQVYLKCTSVGCTNSFNPSGMFVEGKSYKAYDNGLTYHVIDEVNCVRVVSKSDMSFIVENGGFGMIRHAYFELEKKDNDLYT